ncbi:MAG: 2Fe-2S iron-sulfur cluster binding domain-containing protein [Spongiibacteraceae bacterium]|nr:2Fe-2S iron-sulfur cluster binding domain-containing protein [Spongiibacteraceae bacterium]
MPKVVFKDSDGNMLGEVDVEEGTSIMQAALDNGIEGFLAECGGACSCATCHCYVDDRWLNAVGEPGEMEEELLGCVLEPSEKSRLACQVFLDADIDGVEIIMPTAQY